MQKRILPRTIVIFVLTLILCLLITLSIILNQILVQRLTMEKIIAERAAKIDYVISRLFYRTQTLSTFILQNNGETEGFERLAAVILDDPAILNVLIAPDGVVSEVYPLDGNEAVIGLDFFAVGAGNREAILAKESRQLVLGGPFNAIQGRQIIVGRLPVFINGDDFWGLVSVTLRYPDALHDARLDELVTLGFDYELWRINPDDEEIQIIASSGHTYNEKTNYVESTINIAGAEWYLRILSVRKWYQFFETWALIILSIAVSFLVAAVAQSTFELKHLKDKMELLSNTDSLTGIHNRRFFMEAAIPVINRDERLKNTSYIFVLDVDRFKNINDTHGHAAGDAVLIEIASRIAQTLRSYDLFARYGGEEFIMLVSEIDEDTALQLAQRIRHRIAETPIAFENTSAAITASLGVAQLSPDNDLDDAIRSADKALYSAKSDGRDKVVLFQDT